MDDSINNKAKIRSIYYPIEDNQIRLLSISPRSEGTEIHCTLKTVSIDDPPSPVYVALSYTWGLPEDTRNIFVNGQAFPATKNLKAALELFRETQNPVPTLWVDAICINQKDCNERTKQVQLMQKIFSQAQVTWVWLGPERDESNNAFDLIRGLSHDYLESCPPGNTKPEAADRTTWGTLESRGIGHELVAFHNLLARDYWYRVWVVQEIAVSKKIVIFCGQQIVLWESMLYTAYFLNFQTETEDIIRRYRSGKHTLPSLQLGIQRILSIQSVRNDKQGTWDPTNQLRDSLLFLLSNHRHTKSSELKDKYIALAGLVTGDMESIPIVTSNVYDKSVSDQDVYIFATYALAFQSLTTQRRIRALDFLDCAGQPEMENLPSWVPDWSATHSRAIPLFYWQSGAETHKDLVPINAPGHFLARNKSTFSLRLEMRSLLARGFKFDSISVVNTRQSALVEHSKDQNPETLSKKQYPEYPKYPTSEYQHPADVAWRTLVLDRAHTDGLKAPSSWGDIFYYHIKRPLGGLAKPSIFQQWYEENKQFKICGFTLAELVQERQSLAQEHPSDDTEMLVHLKSAFISAVGHRRLATTERGYLCLVPWNCAAGDQIVVLADCSAPVLLRGRGEKGVGYEFIGTSYVHGIMHGEAVDGLTPDQRIAEEFDLR